MRQRSVNEKAVSKLVNYLTEVRQLLDHNQQDNFSSLQSTFGVSKSTFSTAKKLGFISEKEGVLSWNKEHLSDRITACKILEALRHRSDKQTDKPISDLWVAEIASIKELLVQVRDNTKKRDNRSEGFKISERVYIAGQIAQAVYNNQFTENAISEMSRIILVATDDLISKLNL